jgi:hypothetical protein
MLQSTPFYLRTDRAPTAPTDLTTEQLQALLAAKLQDKQEKTPEESATFEALKVIASKESCKEAAGKHKRSRKDDDPDPDSKSKRSRTTKEPSSSQKQPAKSSKAPVTQQQTPASGSGPTHAEEPFMLQPDKYQEEPETTIHESHIPESQPGPSSTSKTKEKSRSTKSKKKKKKKKTKPFSWLDVDEAPKADWFTEMIKLQPPLEADEPLPRNTLQFTQSIMTGLQVEKMTKAELRRINREALDFRKSRSGNNVELQYHMENIACALSGSFDWLNPEANNDAHSKHNEPYFTD